MSETENTPRYVIEKFADSFEHSSLAWVTEEGEFIYILSPDMGKEIMVTVSNKSKWRGKNGNKEKNYPFLVMWKKWGRKKFGTKKRCKNCYWKIDHLFSCEYCPVTHMKVITSNEFSSANEKMWVILLCNISLYVKRGRWN